MRELEMNGKLLWIFSSILNTKESRFCYRDCKETSLVSAWQCIKDHMYEYTLLP